MAKSEPVPNFALRLSWNTISRADASNNIVLLPAATKVTSSAKFEVPSTSNVSIFAVPSIYKSPHSLVAAPMFLVPSASGIKLLPIDVNVDIPLILRFLPDTSS